MLVDAAGESVIEGGDGLYEMSPHVREIVRATPEMASLLRVFVQDCPAGCPCAKADCPYVAAAALLARIDAAKAKGR